MTEPTKEQIQKFWQWCEWKTYSGLWETYPELDLNNLFKYAVLPTIQKIMDVYSLTQREAMTELFTLWLKKFWGQAMSIEDALFWAIWEVIEVKL